MSAKEAPQNNPSTSPHTPRVTFRTQSTPISSTRAGPSNTQASSPEEYDNELSREEVFENNLNQLFTKSFLAVLTSKDAVLKEIRDCVMQDDEARCKEVSTYIHSFWKDLHVKSGCLCVDQRVAIPNSIKEAVLESIHMTHPGSWGMISLSQYAWWPYMHREILAKTSDCVPCTDIGKNLKPIIPKSKWHPHKACQEPNEEIQIDFGGPLINDKDKDIYFLTCIDRYSKYPTVRIFENANGVNVLKVLRDYAYTHGIPRTIRLDQATCLVGKQVTNYCNENNIDILDAPVGDHRAIGLVERMIQTIKRRLACMKAENKNTFSTAKAIKQIVSDLRLTKQKIGTNNSNASINPFIPRAQVNNYNSEFISNFNCRANQLLQSDTTPASRIQSQNSNCHLIASSTQQVLHINMSAKEAPQNNPSTSPHTPRVTFRTQSTPISSTRAGPSNTQASSSPEEYDIELSREEVFEKNLNQLCTKSFLAVLTSKEAVLKEIRDCVLQHDEARCKEVSTYIHSFWKDLHVKL